MPDNAHSQLPNSTPAPRGKAGPAPEVILAGAVYDRQTIVRWLGGRKSWAALQRAGLRFTRLGRKVIVRGQAVLDVFERLEAEQHDHAEKEAPGDA